MAEEEYRVLKLQKMTEPGTRFERRELPATRPSDQGKGFPRARPFVQKALGVSQAKEASCSSIIGEYHKLLWEATEKYPTKEVSRAYLKVVQGQNKKKVKNAFSLLPPTHQRVITQMLNLHLESSLDHLRYTHLEMERKLEALKQFELQLEKLNYKIQGCHQHIQDLEVKKAILKGEAVMDKFMRISQTDMFIENLLKTSNMLKQAHSDGFQLGLTHGKLLNQQIEENLLLSQGQMNGLKHGWLSGFEAGQVSGIKKVFTECYMLNINLAENLKLARAPASVLDQINYPDLRRECLSAYEREFSQLRLDTAKRMEFKRVVEHFRQMTTYEKLKHKKMSRGPLEKAVTEIYAAYVALAKRRAKQARGQPLLGRTEPVTLTDAIYSVMSLNFGNTPVTDGRIQRVLSSAHFLAFTHERRHQLERSLFYDYNVKNSNLPEGEKQRLMEQLEQKQAEAMADLPNMRINYKIIHFVKFCKLSEATNNFSAEVFEFYIGLFTKLRDDAVLGGKKHGEVHEQADLFNRIKLGHDREVDVVAFWRVEQCIHFYFAKLLPPRVMEAFRRNTELGLRVVTAGQHLAHWIDFERFLDHSVILFLRFNELSQRSVLHQIFFAWTLFSVDYLDFDQLYLTLKLLYPVAAQVVKFTYTEEILDDAEESGYREE